MRHNNQPLLIYGNVLLESEVKFDFFRYSLPLWLHYWNCPARIRVRGRYAEEASAFCASFRNVDFRPGSEYATWRVQTMADLADVPHPFIFQYLEDHLPNPDAIPANIVLDRLTTLQPDIVNYSWFHSYEPLRRSLVDFAGSSTPPIILREMDVSSIRAVAKQTNLHLVSLSSVFRRDFYVHLLRSPRPLVRRFDPTAPFDVEQVPSATWFAPISLGLMLSELGVCIDDDHLVPGSSAMERGFYPKSGVSRQITHHKRWSLRAVFGSAISTSPELVRFALSKVVTLLDTIRYSLEAVVIHAIDVRKYSQVNSR